MTLKFHNIAGNSFPIMSSLDAMFEASPVYFPYVNERAAHLKIEPVSLWCRPGP